MENMFSPEKKSLFHRLLIKLHLRQAKPRTIADVVRDAFIGSFDHTQNWYPYMDKMHVTFIDKVKKEMEDYIVELKPRTKEEVIKFSSYPQAVEARYPVEKLPDRIGR